MVPTANGEQILMEKAKLWLEAEDRSCSEDRIERLVWLSSLKPHGEGHLFFGGLTTRYLFAETEYCFAYGQFLASILCGIAFLEKTLAAQFYAAGRNDLKRANISQILLEAVRCGMLTNEEYGLIERIRKARNPIAHFREPMASDGIERRAHESETHFYDVAEADARSVIVAAYSVLRRMTF